MSDFMTPKFHQGKYYAIETGNGTEIIPFEACGECRSVEDLKMYLEGAPYSDELPEPCEGWIYRLSADGYMDATDWSVCDSEIEMLEEMLDYYGTGNEDWEAEAEERLAELLAEENNG